MAGKREVFRDRGRFHSGHSFDSLEELLKKICSLLVLRVFRFGQRQSYRENIARIKSQANLSQTLKTLQHQPGAD